MVINRGLADDRGVGTVLGVMLGLALLCAGTVISGLVSISVTHQRASVAADLAALAAASQGCEAAERVARAQGAIGVACASVGPDRGGSADSPGYVDAVVTVALPAPVILERLAAWSGNEAPVIASSARAGFATP